MMSVGETLRQARLRRKIELAQVSGELKISARMLEAIEADEYHKLPGGVFAKNFVRQYAAALGLDGEEVSAQFEQTVQSPELTYLADMKRPYAVTGLPRIDEPRFSRSGRRSVLPSLIAVVAVMLICSGVYGWWQRSRQRAAARQEIPQAVEARRAAPAPAVQTQQPPSPAQLPQPVATVAINPTLAPAASSSPVASSSPAAAASSTPAPVLTATAAPAAAAPPTALPPGVPQPLVPDTEAPGTGAVRVELVAAEPVWVSVERDGHAIYQGELQPNEIRTVAANTEITLKLGNAGGVTIFLNGKAIPPPGPKGQVRTVQLTSGGFQIVPPAAPAPASAPKGPALLEPR
jgi:cytoskeleton protein RodZ